MRSAILGVVIASALGCTIWVSNITKDFSSTCMFSDRGTVPCGTCIAAKCQDRVNALCSNPDDPTLGAIDQCAADPSPGQDSPCNVLLQVEGGIFNGNGPDYDRQNAAVCVRDQCGTACSTCVVPGLTGANVACGQCILDKCQTPYLSATGYCCTPTTAVDIKTCSKDIPDCSAFANDGGPPDSGVPQGECDRYGLNACAMQNCPMCAFNGVPR